ncbi:MAG TPA: hypothetical protein VHW65_07475 [Gemmatimonadales bacterium]|jgi:hypothetical protein|nr:hypothetical protein [Gemmatimonadales bacterium]
MRFPLAVASAAIGLALLGGAVHELRATTTGGGLPSDNVPCAYNMWHCSYDGDAYWDGCDPTYAPGMISTGVAKSICTTYHSS